jgi:hypothetical protein
MAGVLFNLFFGYNYFNLDLFQLPTEWTIPLFYNIIY